VTGQTQFVPGYKLARNLPAGDIGCILTRILAVTVIIKASHDVGGQKYVAGSG
jgi:hypothetical protein